MKFEGKIENSLEKEGHVKTKKSEAAMPIIETVDLSRERAAERADALDKIKKLDEESVLDFKKTADEMEIQISKELGDQNQIDGPAEDPRDAKFERIRDGINSSDISIEEIKLREKEKDFKERAETTPDKRALKLLQDMGKEKEEKRVGLFEIKKEFGKDEKITVDSLPQKIYNIFKRFGL
ncbi:MAG TPA: hypothetical protein DIT25_01770 [Candidatus Moranbacteria bacterium]|nr:hypothetical protein [Candidatus Moranbacteria bacterium]